MNLQFAGGDMVAGKDMHKQLVDAGYDMVFLPSENLVKYLEHINHATTVLNPHFLVQKIRTKLAPRLKKIWRG